MSKERTVLLRTTTVSVEAGEAAVGAHPATVASDEEGDATPQGRESWFRVSTVTLRVLALSEWLPRNRSGESEVR